MASRYWVGGTADWDATAGTKWAATSGGAGGETVPGAADSVYIDQDSSVITATAPITVSAITISRGSLDTNGQAVSVATFTVSPVAATTLTLGASTLTLTGATAWNVTSTTNLTFSGENSTIVLPTNQSTYFYGAGLTYGTLSMTHNSIMYVYGENTFTNLSRVPSIAGNSIHLRVENITITGTLSAQGYGAQPYRMYFRSMYRGTPATITAAAVSGLANIDFTDIIAAGASAPWTGTSLGDAGNNTNITFTSAVTRYAVLTANKSWSDTSMWSESSGGATGASSPICHDTVIFDANSFSAGWTMSLDVPRPCADLTVTGVLNSPTINWGMNANVHGNVILDSSVTYTGVGSGTPSMNFLKRGVSTLNTAGVSTPWLFSCAAPTGTLRLLSNLSCTTAQCVGGTFDANGFNVTMSSGFNSVNNAQFYTSRALLMGSGTWELGGTGAVWNTDNGGLGFTVTPGTSTIKITDTTATAKTFAGSSKTYNNLWFTGGSGTLTIGAADSNTFNDLRIDGPATVALGSSQAQTITTFTRSAGTDVITIGSSTPGTAHNLVKAGSGTISTDYLSLTDSHAEAESFYAGHHSTDGGGNTGWKFYDASDVGLSSDVTLSEGSATAAAVVDSIVTALVAADGVVTNLTTTDT